MVYWITVGRLFAGPPSFHAYLVLHEHAFGDNTLYFQLASRSAAGTVQRYIVDEDIQRLEVRCVANRPNLAQYVGVPGVTSRIGRRFDDDDQRAPWRGVWHPQAPRKSV